MTGPFWNPGEHPHGLCWVQDERKLCFVNIPKCASSSMKQALEPVGFVEQNFNDRDFVVQAQQIRHDARARVARAAGDQDSHFNSHAAS